MKSMLQQILDSAKASAQTRLAAAIAVVQNEDAMSNPAISDDGSCVMAGGIACRGHCRFRSPVLFGPRTKSVLLRARAVHVSDTSWQVLSRGEGVARTVCNQVTRVRSAQEGPVLRSDNRIGALRPLWSNVTGA